MKKKRYVAISVLFLLIGVFFVAAQSGLRVTAPSATEDGDIYLEPDDVCSGALPVGTDTTELIEHSNAQFLGCSCRQRVMPDCATEFGQGACCSTPDCYWEGGRTYCCDENAPPGDPLECRGNFVVDGGTVGTGGTVTQPTDYCTLGEPIIRPSPTRRQELVTMGICCPTPMDVTNPGFYVQVSSVTQSPTTGARVTQSSTGQIVFRMGCPQLNSLGQGTRDQLLYADFLNALRASGFSTSGASTSGTTFSGTVVGVVS